MLNITEKLDRVLMISFHVTSSQDGTVERFTVNADRVKRIIAYPKTDTDGSNLQFEIDGYSSVGGPWCKETYDSVIDRIRIAIVENHGVIEFKCFTI